MTFPSFIEHCPDNLFHRFSLRFREKRGQKVKSASFVKRQKEKKPELCVSVDNEMNATTGQESCFSSDYLIPSLIFAYKRLLSSAVSLQISPFLSYMTGNKAVSHAFAGRYKRHIAAERRIKKTKRIPRINHDSTNVQRFLTKFFRGVFGRSTSSTVLCISVFCHVVFFQLCCVALCCDLLCVVFLSFPCCVALCCVAICCVYCSCLLPVVLRCVVLRFATVFA